MFGSYLWEIVMLEHMICLQLFFEKIFACENSEKQFVSS